MIFTDDTRPSHFTFANQVGVQTGEDEGDETAIPDELRRAIESHLWLTNLEVFSGMTPTMSVNSETPRQPHPDGPTTVTRNQLATEQIALAHANQDVSRMLQGVVSNTHLLAKFSRGAGFTPDLGHAHYIYACHLKSHINSSCPPYSHFKWIWIRTCPRLAPWPWLPLCLTRRSEWHKFPCHSSTSWSRRRGACQLLCHVEMRHTDSVCWWWE